MVTVGKSFFERVWARVLRVGQALIGWSRRRYVRRRLMPVSALCVLILLLAYASFAAAPIEFPVTALIKIRPGESLAEVAQTLKAEHLIRSPLLFEGTVLLVGGESSVVAGNYFFPAPENAFMIAYRMAQGDFKLTPVRITVPEGASNRQIAQILKNHLVGFDEQEFLKLAQSKEGYLYPDTYFFLPGEEPQLVIARMQKNFNQKIATVQKELALFGKPLPQVLTMASLLEKEASKMEDRQIIAGILWQRAARGMPLQVDAVFPYIFAGKPFDLGDGDLRVDSPYNTYTNKGLPPGPIGNPSLDAILAAVTPIKSQYVYYLSDREGNFHYSTTYAQHLQAKAKYLGS
jgi:UPF0755 protein